MLNDNGGAATAAAAASDVAIVFVGNHPTCGEPYPPWGTCPSPYEGREQVDRLHIGLEPAQLALVQSVAAANPRTIVVLVSSFPQAIGWINDNVPAIVHVTNSSQELGNAVADVLFGDYNPGGHTTTTWYQSETDIPTGDHRLRHQEGDDVLVLHRHAALPFGYGLSYATFEYANLTLSAADAAGVRRAVDVGRRRHQHQRRRRRRGRPALRRLSRIGGAAAAAAAARLSARHHRGRRDRARDAAACARRISPTGTRTPDASRSRTGKSVELQIGASSRDIRLRTRSLTP